MVATVSASLPYRNAISRSADCCNSGAYIAGKIDSAELIARAPGRPRRPGAAPPLNLVQAIVVQDTCRDTVRSSHVLPVLAAARYPVQKIKLRHPNGRVSIPSHIPIFTLILTSSPLPLERQKCSIFERHRQAESAPGWSGIGVCLSNRGDCLRLVNKKSQRKSGRGENQTHSTRQHLEERCSRTTLPDRFRDRRNQANG